MVPLESETVPCVSAVAETLVTVNTCTFSFAGPALSLLVRVDAGISTGVSSSVVAESSLAEGESLTSVTLMLTVETFESLAPSLALNVKLSLPLKSGSGWYDRFAPVPVNWPCAGGVTTVNVNDADGFGLTAVNVIDFDVSSAVVTA